jgi:hypothetical protein
MCAGTPNPKQPPKRLMSKSTKIQIGIANSQTTLPSSRSSEYQKKKPNNNNDNDDTIKNETDTLDRTHGGGEEGGEEVARAGKKWQEMDGIQSFRCLPPALHTSFYRRALLHPHLIPSSSHPHRIPPATRCSSSSPLRSLLQYYSSSNTRTGLVDSQIGLLVRINCVVERLWPVASAYFLVC